MLLVALVPLLIMAIQGYHCSSAAVVELQTNHLRTVLDARKTRINDWLQERKSALTVLASYPCTSAVCDGCCTDSEPRRQCTSCGMLDLANAGNPAYSSLVVYNNNWQRMAQSKQSVYDDSELLDHHFKQVLSKAVSTVVTRPHFHDCGSIWIHMGCPMYSGSTNKSGYMVAALDLTSTIYPILQNRTGLGKTTKTYILSKDGYYASKPFPDIMLFKDKAELPASMLSANNETLYTYRNREAKPAIGMSSEIAELDWVLVAEIEKSEAFAWLSSLRKRAIVTGIITILLVILLALRSAHKATLPLKQLSIVAHEVSEGNFEKRAEQMQGREPQEVADAFNRMLDELSTVHRSLAQAQALAAIGELTSSIVHEMRNPLSSVKMNIKALSQKVADDEMYAELATIAADQADRLENMLNELLQYGKPLKLHPESIKVADLLNDINTELKELSKSCGVKLVIENSTDNSTAVVDREQFRRAITNLGDNAIKASPPGAAVMISAAVEGIRNSELVIRVEDAGTGLTEVVRERLFEPFFTARSGGTGLGLANVRKITELHGGSVKAENITGGGARFTVRLPLEGCGIHSQQEIST